MTSSNGSAQASLDSLIADFNDHPGLPEALYQVASQYQDRQRHEQARQLYQYIADTWPESDRALPARMDVAITNIALGDDAAAQAALDRLIADFNDHSVLPWAISNIEVAYYIRILAGETWVRENYLHPVEIWQKVIRKFPDFFHPDPDLYYFIADCYRQLGEYEKAVEYYGIVAANWTQNGYAVLSNAVVPRAEDDDAAGDYEALHETIDRLIADFNDHPGLAGVVTRSGHGYRRRANDARREGSSTEAEVNNFKAIALYDRVINEFGSSAFTASANFFSALAYRDLGQWQDALDCCSRLLDNWPDYKYAPWVRRLAEDCSERLAGQAQ